MDERTRAQLETLAEKGYYEWRKSISLHRNAIGNLTGFLVAAVIGITALLQRGIITKLELHLVLGALISLFIQTCLWILLFKRQRDIDYKVHVGAFDISDKESSAARQKEGFDKIGQAKEMQDTNGRIEFVLDIVIILSTALVLTTVGLYIFTLAEPNLEHRYGKPTPGSFPFHQKLSPQRNISPR